MKSIVLLLALFVAACGDTRQYYKTGATMADFKKDSYLCERDARGVAHSFGGGLLGSLEAGNFARRCMDARGWELR